MKLKKLAETLVLQSIEDLWDVKHRADSIDFIISGDFHFVADLAGMNADDKIHLMRMVKHISRHTRKDRKGIIPRPADRVRFSPRALSASPMRH